MAENSINLPRQSAFPSADKHRGSILIIALWSLCLLTTFALILGYQVRQKLVLVNRLEERDKLHFLAEAGIKEAVVKVKEQPEKTYYALTDALSNDASVFKDIAIGGGTYSLIYDYPDERRGTVERRYGLLDEESKVNINTAEAEVLECLFRFVLNFDEVEAQELAASIIDWRDSDSELSIPLGSAEDSCYRNLQVPYEAKDGEFEVLREVLLVKGMDQDNFDKIKNYITIYGSGKINVNTASKPVLLALGIGEDIADKILAFRAGEDGVVGTTDDNIFDTPSNIVPRLSQFCRLSDSEIAFLSQIQDRYLVTDSDNFMARCLSQLDGQKNNAQLICVLNRSGKLLSWQE